MKILITGATGFVGSALTRQLVEGGADVRIFRRSSSTMDLLNGVAPHVEHAVGDLGDPRSIRRAMEGVDQVYHAAAQVGFGGRSTKDLLHRINVQGTAHVVNAAADAGVQRLVHTSSMAALGPPTRPDGFIDEASEWRPNDDDHSDYAASKRDAELEIHRGIAEGLDAVIVNPSLIFGVGRPGENTRRIIDAVRKERLPGIPEGSTNVVDVKDVAAGLRKAMMRGTTGERYFLGSENMEWADIIQTLADAFGVAPPQYTLPPAVTTAAAAVAEAVAFVTRTEPVLTRTTARLSAQRQRYDNTRACEELGCTFRPFQATARRIAGVVGTR